MKKRAEAKLPNERAHSAQPGFSLLEVVGVLVVVAALSAATIPSFLESLKAKIRDREISNLNTFAQGFKQYVLRTKTIPDHTTWAVAVAAQCGWALGDVVTNLDQNPRVFLIDPALRIGTADGRLPYTQPPEGSNILPVSPRLIILSSMHRALPVSSGVAASSVVFNDIWSTDDGKVPADWPAEWAGKGRELLIRRINLAPLSKRVILYNSYAPDVALYSVEGGGNIPVGPTGFEGHYIEGTQFTFFDTHSRDEAAGPRLHRPLSPPTSLLEPNTTVADLSQFITKDIVFNYEQNRWIGQNIEGRRIPTMDIEMAANLFLDVRANPNAKGNATQQNTVDAMVNYLQRYAEWQAAGYPTSGAAYASLQNAHVDMAGKSKDVMWKPGIKDKKGGP